MRSEAQSSYQFNSIAEEGEGCSDSDHLFRIKSAPLHRQHGNQGHHHPRSPGPGVGGMHHDGRELRRQNTPGAVTDSTMLSDAASSRNNTSTAPTSQAGGHNDNTNNSSKKKKKGSRFGKLAKILKPKKRTLSESQLRKKVRKAAEKSDWEGVRKLLANYEFSDIPEAMPKRGSFNPAQVPVVQEEPASRRPSYGSRSGERRSFTGKESAAAAAVIKAAMLEESSESAEPSAEHRPDIGENILHDVCRFQPPLDVLDSLLAALRHRRGSTYGTDDQGRTPLHVAANSGASPEVIDVLIRADPTPASMGDKDRRSPLHLVMKHLVHTQLSPDNLHHHHNKGGKHQSHERIPSPEETIDRALAVVMILKTAMLSYPGKIDFKDDDKSGYSPLDYAIDGEIKNKAFIHALIRRRDFRRHRSSLRGGRPSPYPRGSGCGRSLISSQSSITEDPDFDVLEQLEREEIEARKHRIDKIKAKRRKERMNDALFDVFGIDELAPPPPAAPQAQAEEEDEEERLLPPRQVKSAEDVKSQESPQRKQSDVLQATDEDIYNRHLQEYLDDYMDDFDGLEEHVDEDGFDIFADPELDNPAPRMDSIVVDGDVLPVAEIEFVPDQDDVSVVSEVTVPVTY